MKGGFAEKALLSVLLAAGVVALLLGLWALRNLVLLIFAGILCAVFLRGLTNWVSGWSRLPDGVALAAVVLFLFGIFGGLGFFLAPSLAQQSDELFNALPGSVKALEEQVRQFSWGRQILQEGPAAQQFLPSPDDMLSRLGGAFTTVFGVMADVVIILFIGLFVAIAPSLYLRGLVRLFPPGRRARISEVFDEAGEVLSWWLIGRFSAMTLVGVLTWSGLMLLGVPLALPLSLLVMLLGFIPNLGPILAALPAVLIGFSIRPMLAVYVAGLYLVVQTLEGYVITPLIQQRAIQMPPALLIAAIVAAALLFGFLGMLLATPVTAVLLVFVKRFYLEDVLGDAADARESRKE